MWLSLLIAIATYLLSPRGTANERRQALLNGALAGVGTYAVATNTEWGANVSSKFDAAIGVTNVANNPPGSTIKPDGSVVAADGSIISGPSQNGLQQVSSSLWDEAKKSGVLTYAAAAGLGAVAASTMPAWVIPAAVGVLLFMLIGKK